MCDLGKISPSIIVADNYEGWVKMDDKDIIDAYLRRDESAITATKAKYGRSLYNLAFRILQMHEDAEECESDTYLKAWNSIPPTIPVYFQAYLLKITRRLALGREDYKMALKRKGVVVELSEELYNIIPGKDDIKSLHERKEITAALNSFFRELEDEKNAVFMRKYILMQPVSQIARELDMGESKVKMILSRTRENLKKHLKKEGVYI